MKFKINRKLTIFLIFGLLACVVGAVTYTIISNNSKVTLHSFEMGYSDIKSMCDKSDLIIVGEIKKIKEDIIIDRSDYYMSRDIDTKEELVPINSTYTVSDVKIDKVLKGNINNKETIELLKEIATPNINNSDLKNVKRFKEKDKYIFFFKYYDLISEQSKKDFKTPKYYLVHPKQGTIQIRNASIVVDEKLNPLFKNGMLIEDVEKIINDNL